MSLDPKLAQDIVDYLTLSDTDREIIKRKRGFDDTTIDLLKFRTIGYHLKDDSFIKGLDKPIYDSLTSGNNILIPYFYPDGRVSNIRPHKFGIKDNASNIYIPWPIIQSSEKTWVLTEGEFKAVASCMYGVPAIAVPGISSYAVNKLPALLEVIRNINPAGIIIAFDNEIKDNPKFKNYKDKYTKRYDSQFYAYVQSKLIEKELGKDKVAICELPLEHAKEGKVDIDGLLAQGLSKDDFIAILHTAVRSNEYRKSWDKLPPSHLSYLQRRVDRFFYHGRIKESFNCLYRVESKNKTIKDETVTQRQEIKIANFTIRMINTLKGSEGLERQIIIKSAYGNSRPCVLSPSMMASKQQFINFLYTHGDYCFTGNDADMPDLWEFLFLTQDGSTITKIDKFGYDKEHDFWVFGHGIYKNKTLYPVDESGICYVGDEGFSLLTVEDTDLAPPVLETTAPVFDIDDVRKKMAEAFGLHNAKRIIAWVFGVYLWDKIIEEYENFPQLFYYGVFGAGKTSAAKVTMSFFGQYEEKGYSLDGSTKVGLTRIATRNSGLPFWIEEARNAAEGTVSKNSLFRSIYDRTSIAKGTKNPNEIRSTKTSANCLISGEEYPSDAATVSRCLLIHIDKQNQRKEVSKAAFDWLMNNKSMFSFFGHSVLLNADFWWERCKKNIDEYIDAFKKDQKISVRARLHNALIGGIADTIFGEDEKFSQSVYQFAKQEEVVLRNSQMLNVFWQDVYTLVLEKKLNYRFYQLYEEDGMPFVKINFAPLYGSWEKVFKNMRKEHPVSKNSLIEAMKQEGYYIDHRQIKFFEVRPYCLILKFNRNDTPEPLFNTIMYEEGDNITSIAHMQKEI